MATKFSHNVYTGRGPGYSGQRAFVGYYSGDNWWLRCSFTTGANYVSDITYRAFLYNGSSSNLTNYPIGAVITTNEDAYVNAGAGKTYEATMKYDTSVSGYNASVKINKILNPNTTYYLFLCPNFSSSFRHYFYDGTPTYVAGIWGEHNVASTITATNANITEQSTLVINSYNSGFTHTLTYTFGNLSGTIMEKTSNTNIKWTLPSSFYSVIPNATNGTGTITCQTYNGNTLIGTSSCSFRATASPDLCKPTLVPMIRDISPETTLLTGNEDVIVKYYSDVEINIGASSRGSATLTAVNCACGNKSIGEMTGTLYDVESGKFDFSATDSRGYSTTTSISMMMIDYIKLTCNVEVENPTATGVMDFKIYGNYFNNTFGAKNNSLNLMYRIKENDDEYGEWVAVGASISGNTYSYSTTITGLNYLNSYTVQARANDMLLTINSQEKKVKSIPVFDWSEFDFNFNVPVNFNAGFNGGLSASDLLDILYPVGALYLTLGSSSPASFLGGSWSRRTDRFLLGGGNAYTVGNTGGSSTHTLTVSEMPSHTHIQHMDRNSKIYNQISDTNSGLGSGSGVYIPASYSGSASNYYVGTASAGGGGAHNNMPPYLVVNIWQRTA